MEVSYLTAGTKGISVPTLMPIKLQRRDEICSNVNVAKAEKINWMTYAEIKASLLKYIDVLSVVKMRNQQRSPEQGCVQRLAYNGGENLNVGQ